jgi:ribose 5-phosphate isomerase B
MIFIGSDHAGFDLKQDIIAYIKEELKLDIEDQGCLTRDSVDYPDYAKKVCEKVKKENGIGILICGTGIGMSIYANKVPRIRCALCTDEYSAEMTRMHNNANVLAMGGRVIGAGLARNIVKKFLNTGFEGGKHQKRLDKISALEG